MIIKSFQVKSVLEKNINFFLLYGDNEGFKNQVISDFLCIGFKENILRYEESEILKNSEKFFAEINNKSFFDNKKIIIISRISDKFFSVIEEIKEKKLDEIRIVLNAASLEKKSKIRGLFEKDGKMACIPFYADDNSTLNKIAMDFFKQKKISISFENINLLTERCRGDRENLFKELEKIQSFSKNKKNIKTDEILKLTNLAENYSFSEICDHCLNKNLKKMVLILNENNFSSEDCIAIIRIMLSKAKRLTALKEKSLKEKNLDTVISEFRPPIFWKDKDIIKSQLKLWELNQIRSFMYLLSDTELLIKKENQSAINITNNFLLTHSRVSS